MKAMKRYFENCKDLDEVKKEYRRLAKANHPDIGGDSEIMKQINSGYDIGILQALKNLIHKPRKLNFTRISYQN
jgi:hypothetical protein